MVLVVEHGKYVSNGPRSLHKQVQKIMHENTLDGPIFKDEDEAKGACTERQTHGPKFLGPLMYASHIEDGKVRYTEVTDLKVGPMTPTQMHAEIKTVSSPFTGKPARDSYVTPNTFMHYDDLLEVGGESSG